MSDGSHKKPFELTFEKRDGYLYVYVEGEHDSYEISRAYWEEIAREVSRNGIRKVLIDENIQESASMADVFQLATELPKMGFGETRVAFVDRYLNQQDVNSFAELVAVNRGFNGKLFNSIPEAEAWLLGS